MDTHPDTKLIIDGEETPVDDLDWQHYRKTKPAEAVQIDEPFQVVTLEGTFDAKGGDYLMRGPAGEMYSCARDIFEDTYADDDAPTVVQNNFQDGGGIDGDFVMWAMWLIGILAFLACVTGLIWHAVDQQTGTNIEQERTRQQVSKEWEQANATCVRDEQPRICIERAHGYDQYQRP